MENTEFTPNISFADISLRSEEAEKEKEKATMQGSQVRQFEFRPRSISCAASLHCNHIEKAFLINSPGRGDYLGHNSCKMQGYSNSIEVKRFVMEKGAMTGRTRHG